MNLTFIVDRGLRFSAFLVCYRICCKFGQLSRQSVFYIMNSCRLALNFYLEHLRVAFLVDNSH